MFFVRSGSLQEVAGCEHRDRDQERRAGRGQHPQHRRAQSAADLLPQQDRQEPGLRSPMLRCRAGFKPLKFLRLESDRL